MRIIALIPAYNEATTIADVIRRTRPFVDAVIVINDGSRDETEKIAREEGALVYAHAINRGLGAGIGTGLVAALKNGADVIVTLDADGQHDPSEIPLFLEAIQEGAQVVIGSRMRTGLVGMPSHRKLATFAGNLVTFFLFGVWVTDSQSGFRAFTREAAQTIHLKTNRMEVSSEILFEAHQHKLHLKEVPIKAIYTDYSLSKGQSFFVGIKTLFKLVLHRLAK